MITNWFAIPDHVFGQVFVVFIALVSCLEVIAGCFLGSAISFCYCSVMVLETTLSILL